jgi:pyruvate/2-oxoglutarate dehydrogenase complex dihydrolipoamide acyltransferase (E2) component
MLRVSRATACGCRYGGTIVKVHHAQGDVVKVGAPLVDIRTAVAAADGDAAAAAAATSGAAAASSDSDSSCGSDSESSSSSSSSSVSSVLAAPTVRRLARELGVDLVKVKGSGPSGRILREDVEAYKQGLVSSIADSLVDHMAAKTGPASTAAMYAAAAEPMPESAAREAAASDTGAAVPAAAGATAAAAGTGGSAHATSTAASAGAGLPSTRVPIRGYRRCVVQLQLAVRMSRRAP